MKYLIYILPFLGFAQQLTTVNATVRKGLSYKCDVAVLSKSEYAAQYIKGTNTILYLEPNVKIKIRDNVYGVKAICNAQNDSINKPTIYMRKCEKINTKVCINVNVVYPNGCEFN